jgi:hypothetical protein
MTNTDPTGLAPYVNGVYDGPYDPDHQAPEVTYGPGEGPEKYSERGSSDMGIPHRAFPSAPESPLYYDDYENHSTDPTVITGRNLGEPELPHISIVITYDGTKNKRYGASTGTLSVYYSDDTGSLGRPVVTLPVVSGGNGYSAAPKGTYLNLAQELTGTSSNDILKNPEHGGSGNIIIRLPGTGGDAIHQGNDRATQDTAFSKGCVQITATEQTVYGSYDKDHDTNVSRNYTAFKAAINPYGYTGVNINVIIK